MNYLKQDLFPKYISRKQLELTKYRIRPNPSQSYINFLENDLKELFDIQSSMRILEHETLWKMVESKIQELIITDPFFEGLQLFIHFEKPGNLGKYAPLDLYIPKSTPILAFEI